MHIIIIYLFNLKLFTYCTLNKYHETLQDLCTHKHNKYVILYPVLNTKCRYILCLIRGKVLPMTTPVKTCKFSIVSFRNELVFILKWMKLFKFLFQRGSTHSPFLCQRLVSHIIQLQLLRSVLRKNNTKTTLKGFMSCAKDMRICIGDG